MTRNMHRGVFVFVLALGQLMAGSGVAQSENGFGLYTVHATSGRVTIAESDCGFNGTAASEKRVEPCGLNYQIVNANRLSRILCDAPDGERLPPSFTTVTMRAPRARRSRTTG